VTIPSTRADHPTLVRTLKHYTPHRFDQHTPLPPTVKAWQIGSINISADFNLLTLALNPQSVVLTVASKHGFLLVRRRHHMQRKYAGAVTRHLMDNL